MKRPARRSAFTWPSATTVIAVLALLLGVVQLAFTVPVLTQFYIKPDLVVSSSRPFGDKSKVDPELKLNEPTKKKLALFTSYMVANEGNAAATKIEVGFIVAPRHAVSVRPSISANVIQDESALIKHVRVEVAHLAPGEMFTVVIFPDPAKQQSSAANFLEKAGMTFPSFAFARSAEGPGRYLPAEGEKGYWSGTTR